MNAHFCSKQMELLLLLQDNVYGVYHGRAIARVHPVHLMNVEWHQAAADSTKPDNLGCESACTGCQSLHPPSPFIIITQPES